MTYRCTIRQWFIFKDAEVLAVRELYIEFAPFVGLKIDSAEICDVHFHTPCSFDLVAKMNLDALDDCNCKEGDDCCVYSPVELAEILGGSWTIKKVNRGLSRQRYSPKAFGPFSTEAIDNAANHIVVLLGDQ